MIDLTFIHAVEKALTRVISSECESRLVPDRAGNWVASVSIKSVCKRAAQCLYFELDGETLLELALLKLASERSGVAMRPNHIEHEFSQQPLRNMS